MRNKLHRLYDASAENMKYGIGAIDAGTGPPTPIICIQYRNWPREKLKIVRESFRSGIILSSTVAKSGLCDVHLRTRELVGLQQVENEHITVLRAPAWDAHLQGIDGPAFESFDSFRQRLGRFLLLVQSGKWEFLTMVDQGAISSPEGTAVYPIRNS